MSFDDIVFLGYVYREFQLPTFLYNYQWWRRGSIFVQVCGIDMCSCLDRFINYLSYLYKNVKAHVSYTLLHPIISQILNSVYQLSKALNKLILPYLPCQFLVVFNQIYLDLYQWHGQKNEHYSSDCCQFGPMRKTIWWSYNCLKHETGSLHWLYFQMLYGQFPPYSFSKDNKVLII